MRSALEDGRAAGRAGASSGENPHEFGTMEFLEWTRGWVEEFGRRETPVMLSLNETAALVHLLASLHVSRDRPEMRAALALLSVPDDDATLGLLDKFGRANESLMWNRR